MEDGTASCRDRSLTRDGFEWHRGVFSDEAIVDLLREFSAGSERSANRRSLLRDCPVVARLAASGTLKTIADRALSGGALAVRALLFDKVSGANWGVPWHQDLVIAVDERRDLRGFGGWSVKDGIVHVLPAADILAGMISLRLHLDDCGAENGPLRVLPGSHREGRLDDAGIARWRGSTPEFICLAKRGDVLVMRPLLLHASSAAESPVHRRVLHLDHAARTLPGGLRWPGQRVPN